MAEYASKGLANGLGIPALVMSGVALANQMGSGGILGGILGGNNCTAMGLAANAEINAQKDAIIGKLEAEKYTDMQDKVLRDSLLTNWLKPLSQEAAANRERIAVLETEVKCDREKSVLREQLMNAKIDNVAQTSSFGIMQLNSAVEALNKKYDSITVTHIPTTVICPEVMHRYNSWEAPTAAAPNTQPVSGSVTVR